MFNQEKVKSFPKTLLFVGGLFLLGATISDGWYTIDQGDRGVILRTGAISGTADPGFHLKIPFIDSVVKIDVRTQSRVYDNVLAYSRDQQPASMQVSITFRVPFELVSEVYSDYGGLDGLVSRIIDRKLFDNTKIVFGKYNAVTAIQERSRLVSDVQLAVQESIDGPVIIESVQIENIDFSNAYEASVEQRMLAEVEVQKVRQNAEREKVQAEIKVIQAKANAEARVAQASAEAEAIRLKGNAEAEAIRARSEALKENPSLISLVQAEKWNGILPTTMVPNGTVPFLNVENKSVDIR